MMRKLLTAIAGAAVLVAAPTAALAEDVTNNDQRADVWKQKPGRVETGSRVDNANGDVLRTRINHRGDSVFIRRVYRDLSTTGVRERYEHVRFSTNEGKVVHVSITALPKRPGGFAQAWTLPDGHFIDCNVSHRIDYSANTVSVSVPRSCLGNPSWVRVQVTSVWVDSLNWGFWEDALRDGVTRDKPAIWSQRLSRG